MEVFLGALFIFMLRVVDVSIGTLRVLFVMRGKKWVAAGLGLFESAILITAMSQVIKNLNTPKIVGYAAGYAAGILVGISIEQWIAAGQVMVRVISKERATALRDRLFAEGFGVTTVRGEGREAEVLVLFIVSQRRRTDAMLKTIRDMDPHAFVTIDAINLAIGGYMRSSAMSSLMSLKK